MALFPDGPRTLLYSLPCNTCTCFACIPSNQASPPAYTLSIHTRWKIEASYTGVVEKVIEIPPAPRNLVNSGCAGKKTKSPHPYHSTVRVRGGTDMRRTTGKPRRRNKAFLARLCTIYTIHSTGVGQKRLVHILTRCVTTSGERLTIKTTLIM